MQLIEGRVVRDDNNEEYLIEKFIGNGAFGNVFKLKRLSDDTEWALKTIVQGLYDEESLVAFKNEINLATKINDDNVIEYIFVNDGESVIGLPPYIIMEYANNGTLKDFIRGCKNKNKLVEEETLKNIFTQLAKGMKAVNNVLVHRDIKPDNILIKDSTFKISDFGLSKIASDRTRTLTFKGFGHVMYMGPEGWMNDKNTIQMDIYSMGIVFYQLATLEFPYKVTNPNDVEQWKNAHLFVEPIYPNKINKNLSPSLSGVIMKVLEKSTSNRFEQWDEIDQYLSNNPNEEKGFFNIINTMLSNRLSKDNIETQKKLDKERKYKENEEFCKLVKYQFTKDIHKPLEEFIDTFNKAYPKGKITITQVGSRFTEVRGRLEDELLKFSILLVSGKDIEIKLKPLLEKDFIRKVTRRDFEEEFTRIELQIPKYKGRRIKAWGGLYVDKNGFNIILVDNDDKLYGEWIILENSNSGLSTKQRPEPFAFELDELEKEIQYINTTHIYNTQVETFNIKKFMSYISINNI